MVDRSLHGLAPNYLSSKFERREIAYDLRDSENKVNVPLPRTDYYKNNFSYNGAILYHLHLHVYVGKRKKLSRVITPTIKLKNK